MTHWIVGNELLKINAKKGKKHDNLKECLLYVFGLIGVKCDERERPHQTTSK